MNQKRLSPPGRRASFEDPLSPTTSRIFRLRRTSSTPIFNLTLHDEENNPPDYSATYTRHHSYRSSGSSEILAAIHEDHNFITTTYTPPGSPFKPSAGYKSPSLMPPPGFGNLTFGPIGAERVNRPRSASRLVPLGIGSHKCKSMSEAEMAQTMQPEELNALRLNLQYDRPISLEEARIKLQQARDKKVEELQAARMKEAEEKKKRREAISFIKARTKMRARAMGVHVPVPSSWWLRSREEVKDEEEEKISKFPDF